jgi:NAD(P)-dependent dehydrogenase (short-subunit alcohol dehydrogenase family)
VLIVDRDAKRGEVLARELGAQFAAADVTSPADVEAAVARAGEAGPLRIAVSCAGVAWAGRTVDREGAPHDLELFKNVVTINLIGTFNVLRIAAAAMSKAPPADDGERGVIVNTASVAAFDGQIGQVAYAASKAGVVGITLPAARDLSASGVRVLAIAPGTFDTPMMRILPEPAREKLAAGIPFPRRLGDPSEYAALVAHLVENRYLNGEVIRLDGALRMPPK